MPYDQIVIRAVTAISNAITQMIADLPVGAAPEMALESLVEQLAGLEAWQLIMEDPDIQEAYFSEVAALRSSRRPRLKAKK